MLTITPKNHGPDEIAVVTINWNRWSTTLDCLAALRQSRGVAWRLFIVDNASSDDSCEHLRGLGDDVELIEASTNGGWTGGNNIGVKRAFEQGYQAIFVLNNDAMVREDTLVRLLDARRKVGPLPVLGPLQLGVDDPEANFFGATSDEKTGLASQFREEQAPNDGEFVTTFVIKGAGIFASRLHFDTIGYFDDNFYLNCDDSDWCRRAANAGFPLLMVPNAVIRHLGSATLGDFFAPLQVYFRARNRLLFAEKHGTAVQRLRLWRRMIWQAKELAGHNAAFVWLPRLLRARSGSLAAFRRGLADYIARRFGDCPNEIRQWHSERNR